MGRLNVRVPESLIEGLQNIADQNNVSLNIIVNKAVLDFLMENGSPVTEDLHRALLAAGLK